MHSFNFTPTTPHLVAKRRHSEHPELLQCDPWVGFARSIWYLNIQNCLPLLKIGRIHFKPLDLWIIFLKIKHLISLSCDLTWRVPMLPSSLLLQICSGFSGPSFTYPAWPLATLSVHPSWTYEQP